MPSATPTHWVHDLDPFLIQFTETFGIRWYGLSYVLAFAIGYFLLWLYCRKGRAPYSPEQRADFAFAVLLGVIIGGRLGYFVLYQPGDFFANPLVFLKVWEGGMAAHGGYLGVMVALFWFAWKTRTPWLNVMDFVSTLVGPGFLLGRLANFINGELWGRVTDVKWAVIFPKAGDLLPRHPSQLYQAAGEGLLLTIYMQLRFWLRDPAKAKPGQLFGEAMVLYAIVRTLAEQVREPDAALIFDLTRGTFYSIGLVVFGLYLIFRPWKPNKAHSENSSDR